MSTDLKIEVVRVTPVMAKKWLVENNTSNFRRMDAIRVAKYASEMTLGKWAMNGEAIKFSDKVLLDGQHRLAAVVKSGCAVDMLVIRNLNASPSTMDRGKPRQVAQWLSNLGIKSSAGVASIAKAVVCHDKGLWSNMSWSTGSCTDSEIINVAVEFHAEIIDSLNLAKRALIAPSTLGTILFIGAGRSGVKDSDIVNWFVDKMQSGEDLSQNDPVFHLRNRVLVSTSSKANQMTPYMLRMLTTLAWNKTVQGESVKCLKITTTGPSASKLPNKIIVENETFDSERE